VLPKQHAWRERHHPARKGETARMEPIAIGGVGRRELICSAGSF
jgi:hypothetical protein